MSELTFNQLRAANRARLPLFKNRRGGPAHADPDGADWALSTWCNAVLGELGEAANIIKKIERGDMTLAEARPDLADELADVVTYVDLLAFRIGVSLGAHVASKFNRVSTRVGTPHITLPECRHERCRPTRAPEEGPWLCIDCGAELVSLNHIRFPLP